MHSSQRFSRDPACELPRLPAADAADEAAGPVGLPRGPARQDQTENEGSSWREMIKAAVRPDRNGLDECTLIRILVHTENIGRAGSANSFSGVALPVVAITAPKTAIQ